MRHREWSTEPDLRAWLLKEGKAFRRQMCSMLAENPDWSSQAWEQLSHPVDRLAGGGACRLHGWELPEDHPARALGVNVDFVLSADDVLRVVP